jgi:tripartite-type tricarboxylate transporter receptor subunit TctC
MQRRRFLPLALGVAAGALAAPMAARAQAWPSKPIRIIVAGPAGANADIIARLVGEPLVKELGQTAIIEPKPGAAGAIAVGDLVQAPHDGHTLLVGVNALVSEVPHLVKLKIDMGKELKPVAELARGGLVLVANPAFPAKDLAEMIAYVKANPKKVNVANYSPGGLGHVLGLLLNQAAGIDMTAVGYKGSTPALTDVIGGHVPLMFDAIPSSLPHLKAGKVKAFAVSTPKRMALLPDVPTFTELGYPKLEALAWLGLWCSPDVPAAVQARVREATLKVLAQPAVRERMLETGFEVGQPRSVDEMSAGLRADYERMGAVLKSIGFKPE